MAPSVNGRCSTGVANVLSTTTTTPALCPIAAMAAKSKTLSSGLDGVSSQIMRVAGRSAFSTFFGSVMSTEVASMPSGRMTLSNKRNVPPYTSSQATT